MSDIETHLIRWRTAGLIVVDQASKIRSFEGEGDPARATGEPSSNPAVGANRPAALEALLYLGVAVGVIGVIIFTGTKWDDFRTWAKIAVFLVPGALLLLAGQAMRVVRQRPIVRAGGVAWLASVSLLSYAVAVAGEAYGWSGESITLAAGGAATVLALACWAVNPTNPQVVALAGSLFVLATGIAMWPDWLDSSRALAVGLLVAVFAAAALALTELGRFGPRGAATILGSVGLIAGLLFGGYVDEKRLWAELLVFLAAGVLISLSLRRGDFVYMVTGVGGAFFGLVWFIFRHFAAELSVPVALMLTGTLLIGPVLILTRVRSRLPGRHLS